MIEIAVLNSGNSKGPRAAALFYDECAMMSEDLIDDTEGITNGMGDEIYKFYGSTPVINSAFQRKCYEFPERVHPWYHMGWFNSEEIRLQKKAMSPAKWRQENLAHFTAMDGQVFEVNLRRGTYDGALQHDTYFGSDPNPREGYVLTGGKYSESGDVFQFNFVKNFGPNAAGKNALIGFLLAKQDDHQFHIGGIEIEANGVGKPVCDDASAAGLVFEAMEWTKDGKVIRVNEMNDLIIYIPSDKIFDPVWDQLNSLQWSKDGQKIEKMKNVPYHYADSAIHTVMLDSGEWKYY